MPPIKATDLSAGAYAELKRIAERLFRGERRAHTLSATDLVHLAVLRLSDEGAGGDAPAIPLRAQVARAMRHILVEHARARGRAKRGGAFRRVSLGEIPASGPEPSFDLLAVHEALVELAKLDPWQADIIVLRHFGGLDEAEIATMVGASVRTVRGDARMARAWLRRHLERGG